MNNEQLNSLALTAQKGCVHSNEAILGVFVPIINDVVNKVWYRVKDESLLRYSCFKVLEWSIKSFDASKGNFYNYALRNIKRTRNAHLKRRESNWKENAPLELDEEERSPINFIRDVLADVEDEVLIREKVALLAEGDPRRMAILNQWMRGCTNASDLARYLADTFGGDPKNHRVEVHRFKIKCQKALA